MLYQLNRGIVKQKATIAGTMLVAGLFAFVATGTFYEKTNAAPADKVNVCHTTGDGTYQKINISQNAVQKHIDNHGDLLAVNDTSVFNGNELVVTEDCQAWKLVDTVDVSATTNTPAVSEVLKDSVNYKLRASGTFTYTGSQWADAEWYLKGSSVVKGDTEGSRPYVLDVSIDGYSQNTDWGTYNSDHVYVKDYVGAGAPVQFSIYDSAYTDNKGSIKVDIYEQQ